MIGLWDYSDATETWRYGRDDTTYRKGMDFLRDCAVVEDWGCGTGYAKRFCHGSYRGVDGSKGPVTDVIADLREYTSSPDGIFMRHVLEHNHEWRRVLRNALDSFQHRLALIFFTPFQPSTTVLAINHDYSGVPDIGFREEDITELLLGFRVVEETLSTDTQYGTERVFYVTRYRTATQ